MRFAVHHCFLKIAAVAAGFLFAGTGADILLNRTSSNHRSYFTAISYAQAYNEQQLENYAEAVIAIEKLRQDTFEKIQTVLDSETVPKVACNRSESYQNLPSQARSLIINYCNRSKEIVQKQGLTVSEFNQITDQMQSNPKLKEKVQQNMLQLQ